MTAAHVASSDGVELTVHHLVSGEASRPLLVAHATGFHGLAYGPMADRLTGGHDVWALDFRGHGAHRETRRRAARLGPLRRRRTGGGRVAGPPGR